MIIEVTDNLDEHTIFVSYSFYVGDCLWKDLRKNVLYEELEEPFIENIKLSHQYKEISIPLF